MWKCSNEDCNCEEFEQLYSGYENYTELALLDREGEIQDWESRNYGDGDIEPNGEVVCRDCRARAVEYTPEVKKKKKARKAKMNWKDKIDD